ncbi:phospholipid phosphatase 1-like isoform X2 [Lineus longissimus]|uniref:phospholipid phosphatase 1-like isoform X2 n=1 Tax=Lineus longissimus TaxID=88925 RepID=UPI002B4C2CE4
MANSALRSRLVRIFVDGLCLLFVWLVVIIIKLGDIQPFRRGFFCDDQSLMHPYKDDTITSTALIFCGLAVIAVIVFFTELGNFLVARSKRVDLPTFQLGKFTINSLLWNLYKYIGIFGFGAGVCMSFTDVGKYSIGRLRPHFLDVCKPDLSKVNCSTYVEGDVCLGTGATAYQLKNMRLSFPSGHSSYAMYCAFYAMLYLHSRVQWKGSVLLKHLVQAVVMIGMFWICLSRISDYKHHWSDVLGGAVIGIATAIATVFGISDLYRHPLEITLQEQVNRQKSGYLSDSVYPRNGSTSVENPGARESELEGVAVHKVWI